MTRIYLAGPEVFLPDALEVLEAKKRICAEAGLEGVSPLDAALGPVMDGTEEAAQAIFAANRDAMTSCPFAIANITPFRGVSVDPGTAFEIGFLAASGAVVFGYTTDPASYRVRVEDHAPNNAAVRAHAHPHFTVEDFGLVENLMVPLGIAESGGTVIEHQVAEPERRFRDLVAFSNCVAEIARRVDLGDRVG
ncbi:nucleoside 2-deoxyribosyltransferase [Amorphus sp. 3PC139-8]|uniref:nucleoside 2-deoxyribosyltransferase n=1 Tax=Amorphus sp. 3PC139-8 TaxID=2735676 RepID=UPI00345CBF48